MTDQIPVIDLAAALGGRAPDEGRLDAVRRAAEQTGVIQVVNHGMPADLLTEYNAHIGRLLGRPRAEKASLASPGGHPYRGWRQWPDDFGRLELERYNVAQFDTPADARQAGLRVVIEAFPDRAYTAEGRLRSRREPGAVLHDVELITRRAIQLACEGTAPLDDDVDGSNVLRLTPQSLCLHGDNPSAVAAARSVADALRERGRTLRSFVDAG